ncbi:MAG: hypothetical protein WD598_12425 [Acidimicrobiia bacterium]
MPRRRALGAPELSEQASVRLTWEEHEILRAVIHANGLPGTSEALREVVTEFLRAQAEEPDVRLALQAREINRAKKKGKIRSLQSARGRGPRKRS